MMQKFTREKILIERLVRPLGLDVDRHGGPNAGGAGTGAEMLAMQGSGRVGIQATVLDTGAVLGMAVAAETRTEKGARASHGGVYAMWGQNQLMDAGMVRRFVGSAGEWAKP